MLAEAVRENKIETEEFKDELYKVEKEILNYDKPNSWNVYDDHNMERELEVDFQKFGVAVAAQVGVDINKVSTFTFYASLEHLKDKNKPK